MEDVSTAHLLLVDLLFCIALGADLIDRERPTNKIDNDDSAASSRSLGDGACPFCGLPSSVLSKTLTSARWGRSSIKLHPAPGVPFTYLCLRDVVPAHGNHRPHTSDVQISAFQAHIPDSHFGSPSARLLEQRSHRVSPERGLKGKVLTLVDGSYEQTAAFLPSQSISFFLADFGEFQAELARCRVRIMKPDAGFHRRVSEPSSGIGRKHVRRFPFVRCMAY